MGWGEWWWSGVGSGGTSAVSYWVACSRLYKYYTRNMPYTIYTRFVVVLPIFIGFIWSIHTYISYSFGITSTGDIISLLIASEITGKLYRFKTTKLTIFPGMHKSTMMTSSNGNLFCVTGHLCEEFTGHRWIPHKGQWRGAWCSLWSASE